MTLVFSLLLIFLLSFFNLSNQNMQSFKVSPDMALSNFEKKQEVLQKNLVNFVFYTDGIKKRMQEVNDQNLLDLRCSDGIIRSIQGVYVLENVKTAQGEKRRIQNQDFIEFMRGKEPSLPPGKRILSTRVCELEDKTTLLFYTIGVYDLKKVDSQTARVAVLNSNNNEAFIQILSKDSVEVGKPGIYRIRESKNHTRCDQPFQITKEGTLYILCEDKRDFVTSFYVYQINLVKQSSSILETCVNKYKNALETVCH